jgi:hypothetical protein
LNILNFWLVLSFLKDKLIRWFKRGSPAPQGPLQQHLRFSYCKKSAAQNGALGSPKSANSDCMIPFRPATEPTNKYTVPSELTSRSYNITLFKYLSLSGNSTHIPSYTKCRPIAIVFHPDLKCGWKYV